MEKKFFTLINGSTVRIAPKTKIVPQKVFAELADAHNVLEQVKVDADHYRMEVAKECEGLKEQAQRDGFDEGFKKWLEYISKLEEVMTDVRGDLEKVLVPVALKAAKKIVGREIEISEDTLSDIVGNSLKAVSQHKRIVIWVNKKDVEILERNRPKLRQIFESLESMSIRVRPDVAPGGCIIETEGGIINAQTENQWKALENALEMILNKKGLKQQH